MGPINWGLNVGCRLEFFGNVPCQLGNKNVSAGLEWSVDIANFRLQNCWADYSECWCRPTLILM